ncbi:hypothetical protein [Elizabethkingia anophelis]|uniref:hypothetical protein n=1 Tax=Elizabethkingia anophelis TaxID=1117645 RepID=UPI00293C6518|nr:hypothetical protein [Elizabethkingia anophelis]
MQNFSLCSSTKQKIIIKATEEITIYIVITVKRNKKKSTYQKYLISKNKISSTRQFKPKNLLMKNMFISLKDILVSSIGGATGTLLIPKFQEFAHYLERILTQIF